MKTENTFDSINLADYAQVIEKTARDTETEVKSESKIMTILKRKTGAGDVEDYLSHPLNYNGSMPLARILRGVTGLLGATDVAIADIMIGLLQLLTQRSWNKNA